MAGEGRGPFPIAPFPGQGEWELGFCAGKLESQDDTGDEEDAGLTHSESGGAAKWRKRLFIGGWTSRA